MRWAQILKTSDAEPITYQSVAMGAFVSGKASCRGSTCLKALSRTVLDTDLTDTLCASADTRNPSRSTWQMPFKPCKDATAATKQPTGTLDHLHQLLSALLFFVMLIGIA